MLLSYSLKEARKHFHINKAIMSSVVYVDLSNTQLYNAFVEKIGAIQKIWFNRFL